MYMFPSCVLKCIWYIPNMVREEEGLVKCRHCYPCIPDKGMVLEGYSSHGYQIQAKTALTDNKFNIILFRVVKC